ncbi:MAG: chromosome segregation protein ScpA, partial [Bacteroidetes bacterium]
READRAERFVRGRAAAMAQDEAPEEVLLDNSVYDLVAALRRILTRPVDEPVHRVVREEYAVEDQIAFVLERVLSGQRVSFASLVARRSKAFIIATFLAVLELARQGHVCLYVARTDDFLVERVVAARTGSEAASVDDDRINR